jgi:outer membrane protein insertion porin family
VTANFTISGRRQDIVLSFTEPWFLGREIAAGIDLFRTKTDFQSESNFDEVNTGGTLRASYPLTERLRHGVRYTLREDEIENVEQRRVGLHPARGGHSRITSLVGQTLTYDVRDVPIPAVGRLHPPPRPGSWPGSAVTTPSFGTSCAATSTMRSSRTSS